MANWITHTLIADEILKQKINLDSKSFVVGNIAPDCNIENDTWTEFVPPREVTHFMDSKNKLSANYDAFCNRYITSRHFSSLSELSFYLGYYSHLITDVEYQKFVRDEKRLSQMFERINLNPDIYAIVSDYPQTFDTVKKLFGKNRVFKDIAIIENNIILNSPYSSYNTMLAGLKDFGHNIDILPTGAIERKVNKMVFPVLSKADDSELIFFTKDEYAHFYEETVVFICEKLRKIMSQL